MDEKPSPHWLVADLAGRQHGVVSARQLAALGCSRTVVSDWSRAGRLHRLYRGVYAVGHRAISADARRLAAVLAAGEGALASHTTAAAIWGLAGDRGGAVHVSVGRAHGARSHAGLVVHHSRSIRTVDASHVRGIPVTSVARTLADLGDIVRADRVRAAFAAAERADLLDMDVVTAQFVGAHGRRGPRILAEITRTYDPRWADARSGLELAMLDLLAAAGLPAAEVNVWIDGRYVADLLWRRRRLIVEVDGDFFHRSPLARRADALRERELRRLGFDVARVSQADVEHRPAAVADRVARLLATAPPERPDPR